jgi:ABC-type multidrug transport system fused ATPase/permease subunit
MGQILVELIKMANLIISITKALASASRIQSVMDTNSSMTNGEVKFCRLDEKIEFKNVSFGYNGSSENSIENISFTAKRGDVVGIIGGTGSGKTTLINLIPRFYDATEGCITIDGIDIKDYDNISIREGIGIVPQKAVLFSGTIRDNLKWGNENATDDELLEAVKTAQCERVIYEKDGLDTVVSPGGKNFSGGQRQRLTIARALVRKPSILILDDSSSALDYATDAALRRAISEISKDTTVFIVSQRASSIMHADTIIVLDDGVSVGIGTHKELIESCEIYKEIYATQFSSNIPEKEDKSI